MTSIQIFLCAVAIVGAHVTGFIVWWMRSDPPRQSLPFYVYGGLFSGLAANACLFYLFMMAMGLSRLLKA